MDALQEMVSTAAKIKSAQPEEKARREQFELLPYRVKCTLALDEEDDRLYRQSSTPLDERLAFSQKCKARGNELYTAQKYSEAVSEYVRALAPWHHAIRLKDASGHERVVEVASYKQVDSALLPPLMVSCLANLSACHLHCKEHSYALEAGEAALQLDPRHVKSLFRCASAHRARDQLPRAIACLERAVELGPVDLAVTQLLAQCRQEKADQAAREKKAFGGMFEQQKQQQQSQQSRGASAGGLYSDKPEAAAKAAESDPKPATAAAGAAGTSSTATSDGKNASMRQRRRLLDVAPTAEQKREALEKFGVDLDDPLVQEEINRLDDERLAALTGGRSASSAGKTKVSAAASATAASDGATPSQLWRWLLLLGFAVVFVVAKRLLH